MKTHCPTCGMVKSECECWDAVNAASQLGKMAAGVPKKYSPAEIAKRTARLRKAQKNRAKTQRAVRRANSYSTEKKL